MPSLCSFSPHTLPDRKEKQRRERETVKETEQAGETENSVQRVPQGTASKPSVARPRNHVKLPATARSERGGFRAALPSRRPAPVLSSHASGENHHLHQGHTRKPNVLPFLLNKPKQINSKEFLKYTFLLQTVLERGAVGSAKSWHEQERGAGCPGSTVTVWPPGCAHERPTAKRDHGQEGDDGAWHHTGTQHGPRQRTRRAASSRRAPGDTDADVALWTLSWWALWATPSDGSARSATSRPGGATRASPLTAWSWASRRRPCTG